VESILPYDVIALTILLRRVTHADFSEIAFDCERLRDEGLLKAKNARRTKIDKGDQRPSQSNPTCKTSTQ
jgi:hypothetical protein